MEEKAVILVVEDEALIRMGAVQMLEDAGFEVVEAFNAHEAIDILASRADVRAIFTDIHMPGTWDGMRLARMVRDRWPPIHIIVTSGLMVPSNDELPVRGRFIRKPYDPAHVISMLQELLKQDPPLDPIKRTGKVA